MFNTRAADTSVLQRSVSRWLKWVVLGAGIAALACSAESEAPSAQSASLGLEQAISDGRLSAELLQRVEKEGPQQVLVSFREPTLEAPGALRRNTSARAVALQNIQRTQDELEALLPSGSRVVRRFQALNGIVVEADLEGLSKLTTHSAVTSIREGQPGGGGLTEVVPLVGLDKARAAGFTGKGLTVAVVDSGYSVDHADLTDSLAGEACFCTGCCPNGGNTQQGPGAAVDDEGHGSAVSGVITSNGQFAPRGGAPDAKIVAVKVLDSTNSWRSEFDVIAGVDWIISQRPDVDVVNASLGTFDTFVGDCDNTLSAWVTAIQTLRANNVLFFAAAMNNGDPQGMGRPGCISGAMSVAATPDTDTGASCMSGGVTVPQTPSFLTCFSNSSATTDLAAPGNATTTTARVGNQSTTVAGTSFSSPIAAACVAVLLQKDPTLTANALEALLESSPVHATDPRSGRQFPRLDCANALSRIGSGSSLIDADFNDGADGFAYVDDAFGTSQPNYASGSVLSTGSFEGGGLRVALGGIDNTTISNMSGGFRANFSMATAASVRLSLRYRLTQTPEYESNEQSRVLVSVDGNLIGTSGNNFLAELVGNGNGGPPLTTDWVQVELNLGTLSAGSHALTLGGFNNQKTASNESTQIEFDNVLVQAVSSGPQTVLDAHFDNNPDGFVGLDDTFRSTAQPLYSSQTHDVASGFSGGGLRVNLGGIDATTIAGMSGGWRRSFNVSSAGQGTLSLRYNLSQSPEYEANERSEVLVTFNGVAVGVGGNDFVASVVGNGNGGVAITTGWQQITLPLGALSAGSQVLTVGGFNNQKTAANESTSVLIDDVVVTVQ